MAGAAALAAGASSGPSVAQPGAHATRTGAAIEQLEQALLQAQTRRNRATLSSLLRADFRMVVAQTPESGVERDDWLDAVQRAPAGRWQIEALSATDFGDVAVASFVMRPEGAGTTAAPALFVVDTWRRSDGSWRLALRHVAPAAGPRRDIPGDAPAPAIPKKY